MASWYVTRLSTAMARTCLDNKFPNRNRIAKSTSVLLDLMHPWPCHSWPNAHSQFLSTSIVRRLGKSFLAVRLHQSRRP